MPRPDRFGVGVDVEPATLRQMKHVQNVAFAPAAVKLQLRPAKFGIAEHAVIHADAEQTLCAAGQFRQRRFGGCVGQAHGKIGRDMLLGQHRGTSLRLGRGDQPVKRHDAKPQITRLSEALDINPVERVDRQTGDLHQRQSDQHHRRRPRGETSRPQSNHHARSTVAART